eukprot:5643121-Amphidinium_carterae.1
MNQQDSKPGKWGNKSQKNPQTASPNRQTRKGAAGTSWDCPDGGPPAQSDQQFDQGWRSAWGADAAKADPSGQGHENQN